MRKDALWVKCNVCKEGRSVVTAFIRPSESLVYSQQQVCFGCLWHLSRLRRVRGGAMNAIREGAMP